MSNVDQFMFVLSVLVQSVLAGFSSAIIGRIVTDYDGPFKIFPRLRDSLLPPPQIDMSEILGRPDNINELVEFLSEYQIDAQNFESQKEAWRLYFEEETIFSQSFRGTIYSLLNCVFCLGPYMSFFVSLIVAYCFHANIPTFFIIWMMSNSIHFIINKELEVIRR